MFQEEQRANNIFGFSCAPHEPSNFQRTATFFNPSANQDQVSFCEQPTDIPKESSTHTTSQSGIKDDTTVVKIYNPKRIIPSSSNNSRRWFITPGISPLKSVSSLDQSKAKKQEKLGRKCISQEAIRRRLQVSKENYKPGTGGTLGDDLYAKSFTGPKRLPFLSNGHQMQQQSVQTSDSESYNDMEVSPDSREHSSNSNVFRIKTHFRDKGTTIKKFNKIKVISAIPVLENISRKIYCNTQEDTSDKRSINRDIASRSSLRVYMEESNLVVHSQPSSSHSKNPSGFVFPHIPASNSRRFSPPPSQVLERPNRSPTPTTATILKPIPIFLSKCDDYEPLKDIKELQAPLQAEDSLPSKNFQSEKVKFLNTGRNKELGPLASPVVRDLPSMRPNRRAIGSEVNMAVPSEEFDLKTKVKRRINFRFKNEEAVLNKLFNPLNQRKNE